MTQKHFCEIEKPAGPPDLEPIDPQITDQHRKRTYESYERYLRDWLGKLDTERPAIWHRDYSNLKSYLESVEPMRDRFKQMLGFWVEPQERTTISPLDEKVFMETDQVVFSRFTYEIVPGLVTYALRLVPKTPGPRPGLLVQHGYSSTPESACGLSEVSNQKDGSYRSMGLRAAAKHGYHVIAPHHPTGFGTLSDSIDVPLPGHEDHDCHYPKNRLHRMCVMGGGTLIGLDMLSSSRAVDLLIASPDVNADRIGMYGLSRGGTSALFLPAMDTRIKAVVCSAFFNTRLQKLIGPYSKTTYLDWFTEEILANRVRHFSDADIVSLVVPRAFAAEAGVSDGAVDQEASGREMQLAGVHYEKLGIRDMIEFIPHEEGHVSATARAFEFLKEKLG